MKNSKLKNVSRRTFYIISILGLVLNGVLNFFAYKENIVSDELGNRVRKTVVAEAALQEFEKTFYFENSRRKRADIEKDLRDFAREIPALNPVIEIYDRDPRPSMKLREAINNAESNLLILIDQGRIDDRVQKSKVERMLTQGLGFNFVLIALLLILFVLNLNAKRKVETSLRLSQKNLVNSLIILEERLAEKVIETKSVVHELKNPIGTIMGFADIMRERPSSIQNVVEACERIQKISERSLKLVETLLKDGEDRIPFVEVDLNTVAEEVCARMSILAESKKQQIIFRSNDSSVKIYGNEIKLDELITNLISNAIKYSPKGAAIHLSIEDMTSEIRLVVKDNGPGFSAEDKLRAFQYGNRLTATPTAGESSNGIGLFIVKEIANLHHSTVAIEDNENGKGAKIIVAFPKLRDEKAVQSS